MARRSRTHQVAHFKQDNGELAETVVPEEMLGEEQGQPEGDESPSKGGSPYPPHDDPDKRVVGSEPAEDKG